MYWQSEKKLGKQQYFPHMSSQYGELRPTNGWDLLASLGHPSKFQPVSRLGFITAALSLNGGQPNFARCLAVSWTGTLYIRFPGLLPYNGIFVTCKIHSASNSCVLLYWQPYCTALKQWASAKVCGIVQGIELRSCCRWRRLYLAGWPSRLASPTF